MERPGASAMIPQTAVDMWVGCISLDSEDQRNLPLNLALLILWRCEARYWRDCLLFIRNKSGREKENSNPPWSHDSLSVFSLDRFMTLLTLYAVEGQKCQMSIANRCMLNIVPRQSNSLLAAKSGAALNTDESEDLGIAPL